MGSRHTAILLNALRYPGATPEELGNNLQYRQLVGWLENNQIRQLKQEDRAALLNEEASDWQAAFQQYLEEVDCPIPFQEKQATAVLQWLLQLAVSLAYQDNGALMQPQSIESSSKPAQSQQQTLHSLGSDQFREMLTELKTQLQISDNTRSSQVDDLQVARDVVVEQLLPSVEGSEAGKHSREAAQQLASLDQDTFPLGFATGDARVNLAGTIMRMLFIKDLRQLQTLVDEAIVQVQEYTANPKTDSSIGRVGR